MTCCDDQSTVAIMGRAAVSRRSNSIMDSAIDVATEIIEITEALTTTTTTTTIIITTIIVIIIIIIITIIGLVKNWVVAIIWADLIVTTTATITIMGAII